MRPNQNRRMRGRNRSKGPNPLTRTYESNGPDVKIRGTAQHIADKYAQLSRDAQASGDPVGAENYLQHAEHYYRIIAAAQEQYREQFGSFQRPFDDDGEEEGGSFGFGGERSPGGQGEDFDPSSQPQPYDGRQDRQDSRQDSRQDNRQDGGRSDRPRFDRGDRPERDRFEGRDRQDRGEQRFDRGGRPERQRFQRPDRDRQDFQRPDGPRQEGPRHEGPREDYPRQDFQRPARDDQPRRERRREDEEPVNGLPAFLTNPVRSSIAVDEGPDAAAPPAGDGPDEAPNGEVNGRYPRARRRRRRNFEGGEGAPEGAADFAPEGAETPPAE